MGDLRRKMSRGEAGVRLDDAPASYRLVTRAIRGVVTWRSQRPLTTWWALTILGSASLGRDDGLLFTNERVQRRTDRRGAGQGTSLPSARLAHRSRLLQRVCLGVQSPWFGLFLFTVLPLKATLPSQTRLPHHLHLTVRQTRMGACWAPQFTPLNFNLFDVPWHPGCSKAADGASRLKSTCNSMGSRCSPLFMEKACNL